MAYVVTHPRALHLHTRLPSPPGTFGLADLLACHRLLLATGCGGTAARAPCRVSRPIIPPARLPPVDTPAQFTHRKRGARAPRHAGTLSLFKNGQRLGTPFTGPSKRSRLALRKLPLLWVNAWWRYCGAEGN